MTTGILERDETITSVIVDTPCIDKEVIGQNSCPSNIFDASIYWGKVIDNANDSVKLRTELVAVVNHCATGDAVKTAIETQWTECGLWKDGHYTDRGKAHHTTLSPIKSKFVAAGESGQLVSCLTWGDIQRAAADNAKRKRAEKETAETTETVETTETTTTPREFAEFMSAVSLAAQSSETVKKEIMTVLAKNGFWTV